MPSNIEGSLKERIRAYLKNVPARFDDDQDHTVGGFVTKQQVLEALIPVWESELHKAEERGMRRVVEALKSAESICYFHKEPSPACEDCRSFIESKRQIVQTAESLIPKE